MVLVGVSVLSSSLVSSGLASDEPLGVVDAPEVALVEPMVEPLVALVELDSVPWLVD